jgi:hypothetical protein
MAGFGGFRSCLLLCFYAESAADHAGDAGDIQLLIVDDADATKSSGDIFGEVALIQAVQHRFGGETGEHEGVPPAAIDGLGFMVGQEAQR